MKRRNFIAYLGTACAASILPSRSWSAETGHSHPSVLKQAKLKITGVEIWRFRGERETVRGLTGQHQVQPLHIYPEHRPQPFQPSAEPRTATVNQTALYFKLLTNEGIEGS